MKVKRTDGFTLNRKSSDENGVTHMNGEDLVEFSLQEATMLTTGDLECANARVSRLAEIIGRLVDLVPENQRLEVVGTYSLAQVK